MKKILFRFFFAFIVLAISPWYMFYQIPGISYLLDLVNKGEVWVVSLFNEHILHVKDVLNQNGGGSGDTSYAWAQVFTFLILSILICLIWSVVDRKKQSEYFTLDFWFRNLVRYYISLVSFSYGIIKLFALQMPFPNLSQLATPLGDYLPMRFSWMFLGYSAPYQIFSGVAEITVGILLLNRRTVTLGALLGVGVFANVFMLNMSYDIPVKLYSMQMTFYCLYLVVRDWDRIVNFFWFNRAAEPTDLYDLDLKKKWQKITRIVLKLAFVILFVALPFRDSWSRYKEENLSTEQKPVKMGVYDIKLFIKNRDTITVSHEESMWKDFIFDKNELGSINTTDTLFRQRYRRGYFSYKVDSIEKTVAFKKFARDTVNLFKMRYQVLDDRTIRLWGKLKTDSMIFELHRSDRHFQLAERQFHWISEANR